MNYHRPARQYIFHTVNKKSPQFAPVFKAARRKPVKGGRWKIRKFHESLERVRPWKAWREGKRGRRFETWQKAFDYTQEQLREVYNGSDA